MCAVSWALKSLVPTAQIMARHTADVGSLSLCRELTQNSETAATLSEQDSPFAAYFAMYYAHAWMSTII